MNALKTTGLLIFTAAFGLFIASFFVERYELTPAIITQQIGDASLEEAIKAPDLSPTDREAMEVRLARDRARRQLLTNHVEGLINQPVGSNFSFIAQLEAVFAAANAAQIARYGLSQAQIDQLVELSKTETGTYIFHLSYLTEVLDANTPEGAYVVKKFEESASWLEGNTAEQAVWLRNNIQTATDNIAKYYLLSDKGFPDYEVKQLRFSMTKAASVGPVSRHRVLFLFLTYGLAILGAMLYLLPKVQEGTPGIKNNGIFHSVLKNRGWLGIAVGVFLITFYIFLYFFPAYMTTWVLMVDPISIALSGNPAGEFFLYGYLYTLAVLVMGIRMMIRYQHSKYQQVRTASVMFFQTSFAFIIPEILVKLNQPYFDFKNIWPLDYDFFFNTSLETLIAGGNVGIFMLGWGIGLTVIAVPLFVHLFGKRWYCSWVCGCGGLAETLGDPYRQLSDKSTAAWQIERFIIHGVLLFAIVMTAMVLYTFFTEDAINIGMNRWLILGITWLVAGVLVYLHRRFYEDIPGRKVITVAGVFAVAISIYLVADYFGSSSARYELSSFQVRSVYGFFIGSVFSGVVGTGFYPFMGNRVWCRFGCPLAAYLGLVQRFASRFRITTNGGQCISCGNCSTYCEMGIDVRAYAQKGQNIVRSSCVGCGICSAVCPRGVLNLENGPMEGRFGDDKPIIIGNDSFKVAQ